MFKGRKKLLTEARKALGLKRVYPSKKIEVLKTAGDLIVGTDREMAKSLYREALALEKEKEAAQKRLAERWTKKSAKQREEELQRDKEKLSKTALKIRRYRLNKQRRQEEMLESLKKSTKKRKK